MARFPILVFVDYQIAALGVGDCDAFVVVVTKNLSHKRNVDDRSSGCENKADAIVRAIQIPHLQRRMRSFVPIEGVSHCLGWPR
jgi:hypothetical protein